MRAWLSGRASASQAECRGFESRCPLKMYSLLEYPGGFILILNGPKQVQETHYFKMSFGSSPICKWIERSILTKECYAELTWSTIQLYRRQQDIIKERVSRDPAPMSSRPAPQNFTDSLQIPILWTALCSPPQEPSL